MKYKNVILEPIDERVAILYDWISDEEKERIIKRVLKEEIMRYDSLSLKEKIEMEREFCKEEIKNGKVSNFTKFFYPDLIEDEIEELFK